MVEIGNEELFWERLKELARPGEENFLAFYDHRLGAIFTNPRLMLIPLDDHLVHRGDGVFEALRFEDGAIYQLDEHLRRLERSAGAIGLPLPLAADELDSLIRQVCVVSGAEQGNVMVFRGARPRRLHPGRSRVPAAEPLYRGQALRSQARILLVRRSQRRAHGHPGQAGLDVPDQERELSAQRADEKGRQWSGGPTIHSASTPTISWPKAPRRTPCWWTGAGYSSCPSSRTPSWAPP
jgi:hypothetical protein